MREKPLVLIGGGGHCKSCIDVIESSGEWSIRGILEQPGHQILKSILGYEIIGTNDDIDRLILEGCYFLVTIGQIASAVARKRNFEMLLSKKAPIATVVSKYAKVSRHARVGVGTLVHHFAVVNADAVVGGNNIINTGANIEHDAQTGDHTHISTGAILNGNAAVGNECFIGSHSVVIQGINITNNVVVGAGSLVKNDLLYAGTYAGSPCKQLKP